MRKHVCFLMLAALAASSAMPVHAAKLDPIPLWKSAAPGESAPVGEEQDKTTAKDGLVAGKPVIRLGNVSVPTLTVYPAPKEKNTGTAVLVFPGGGYNILALDLEGTEVCKWLNSLGITAVLVKYRVPARPGGPRYAAPLQDAQRAMGLVRHHAREWHIDPNRIGAIGFSAGGHLAAALSTNYETRSYPPSGEADAANCRPDFALLIYPAYLTVKEQGDTISPELTVSANTPPTFLVQTEDDVVRVENSIFYYVALKKAKVPAEMHIFSNGNHGYGLRRTDATVTTWPNRAEEWLRSRGLLRPAAN